MYSLKYRDYFSWVLSFLGLLCSYRPTIISDSHLFIIPTSVACDILQTISFIIIHLCVVQPVCPLASGSPPPLLHSKILVISFSAANSQRSLSCFLSILPFSCDSEDRLTSLMPSVPTNQFGNVASPLSHKFYHISPIYPILVFL